MSKLDWSKAMVEFVNKHEIACFKCRTRQANCAKTGWGNRGRPWAICASCVRG